MVLWEVGCGKLGAQSLAQPACFSEVKSGLKIVNIGQNAVMQKTQNITSVGFKPPGDSRLPVEVLTIQDLRQRAPAEHFEKLQRADFYRLYGVFDGATAPMVDFSRFEAQAGDWLLVRPGQVFRYDFSGPWSGWLVVFRPDSLAAAEASRTPDELDLVRRVDDLACKHRLRADQHDWMHRTLQQMQHDAARAEDPALRNALLRLQLASTLLRLSQWQVPDAGGGVQQLAQQANFRRFRQLLDADFASRHQVQHYAAALGMSEKTLSRVCLAAAGAPAKTLINQRKLLEAKRLLAHTNRSVQAIGSELGFDEASNFVKFFRKESGTTPAAFRRKTSQDLGE